MITLKILLMYCMLGIGCYTQNVTNHIQQSSNSHVSEPGHVMQHSSMSMSHSQHSSSGDGRGFDPKLKAQLDKQHADILKQARMSMNIPHSEIEDFLRKKSVEAKRRVDDHMKRLEKNFKATQKAMEKQMANLAGLTHGMDHFRL
ncbi:unnamed protein product [Bursaphelenchus xylophilus]|uniref:(pine wood nematode) hypothetical protein n=1 Tax=Bursaphelenchus xylophilus TaxID=6326 RepID=A0A1I7SDL9_BURXY|nr:unnamed protein product [Bursaphelenchus xylophilus]CAG9120859.1 unnamed protein product [Bursaphelenchus xylophilus]